MGASSRQYGRLTERVIVIRGAGEMATGIACRLFGANLKRIVMLETAHPLAVRRQVSFCEAVHEQCVSVEGVAALRVAHDREIFRAWGEGKIALLVDPDAASVPRLEPDVLIDATLAKRNLGTTLAQAPLVIALGPGFQAGTDCHLVVETNRGHELGRLIRTGQAEPNTGIPGDIGGFTRERVLRAPVAGVFQTARSIGELIGKGEVVGRVDRAEVIAPLDGMLRGLIRPGSRVSQGLKIGDIDPRGEARYCATISEKARSLGGAVLEAVLAVYNR